jgi:hypothetical protein
MPKTSINKSLYFTSDFTCNKPYFTSLQKYRFHTGIENPNLSIFIRWIGHTLRKEDGEIPKAVLIWNPQGSRKRGRRKNSWRRAVIKEAGRSWNEVRFLAADRSGKNS